LVTVCTLSLFHYSGTCGGDHISSHSKLEKRLSKKKLKNPNQRKRAKNLAFKQWKKSPYKRALTSQTTCRTAEN